MKKLCIVCLLYAILGTFGVAAHASVAEDVETFVQNLQMQNKWNTTALDKASPEELFAVFRNYQNHPEKDVRNLIASLTLDLMTRDISAELKGRIIRHSLDFALSDTNAAVRSNLAQNLIAPVFNLTRANFTDEMRQKISESLKQEKPNENLMLLAGVADVQSAKKRISEFAVIPEGTAGMVRFGDSGWPAFLALARLGDEKALQMCVDMVEAEKDLLQKYAVLSEQLSYTRQTKALNVLVRYLLDDKTMPEFEEFGGKMGGQKYALYTIGPLALMLEDFPLIYNRNRYTDADLAKAREWIAANKGKYKIRR